MSMFHLNIEAYPDLTNIQVVVTTEAPGMSPVEVEQLVTFPIESTLIGMPKTEVVRSVSKLGLSMITVVFDDSMDIYLARQIVSERLGQVRSRIPSGLEPQLGPLATAFGEVYQFTLEGGRNVELDAAQDDARLGSPLCAARPSRHQRNQLLGWLHKTICRSKWNRSPCGVST